MRPTPQLPRKLGLLLSRIDSVLILKDRYRLRLTHLAGSVFRIARIVT